MLPSANGGNSIAVTEAAKSHGGGRATFLPHLVAAGGRATYLRPHFAGTKEPHPIPFLCFYLLSFSPLQLPAQQTP